MKSLFAHVQRCTKHDPAVFCPFFIDEIKTGRMRHETAALLTSNLPEFRIHNEGIALNYENGADLFAARSEALARGATFLAQQFGKKSRNELYAVIHSWGGEPYATIDRSAHGWFGLKSFGVHVNGFVRKSEGLFVWIALRAMRMEIAPGKLDNFVAGGLPFGIFPDDNVVKEA